MTFRAKGSSDPIAPVELPNGIPKNALRVQLTDGEVMNPAAKRTIDPDRL